MSLPQPVLSYLNDQAQAVGANPPGEDDNLFSTGVLDSFSLVDFITILEQYSGVSIPDADVNPANFQTINAIESYVIERKG